MRNLVRPFNSLGVQFWLACALFVCIGCGPSREDAVTSSKNVGKIMLAVNDYEAKVRRLPTVITTSNGKPVLSWRSNPPGART